MKVVLDLDRLLAVRRISEEEYQRLRGFAASETGSLAFNVLIGSVSWPRRSARWPSCSRPSRPWRSAVCWRSMGWAVALIATGVWAARQSRRGVVNLMAVFGAIHFYTQYNRWLDATPGRRSSPG